MRRTNGVLMTGVVVAVLALAGCGGDGGNDAETEQKLDDIATQLAGIQSRLDYYDESIQRSLALNAMTSAQTEDIDGLDEEMQAASEIEAGWPGRAERVLRGMQATVWPEELTERAHGMEEALNATVNALIAEDLAVAKEQITAAHELWHELEHDVYMFGAGPDAEHGHTHGGEATATPSS